MKSTLRCFIALEIPPYVRARIDKVLRKAARLFPSIRWTRSDQFHLTLKFLGGVPVAETPALLTAVEDVCRSFGSFDLDFQGLGAFPNPEQPHTLWVGIQQGTEEATALAGAIDEKLKELGYPKEHRRFTPHLTIGRVRRGESGSEELRAFLAENAELDFGVCEADAVTIYSSELSRRGPKYEPLAEITLGRYNF